MNKTEKNIRELKAFADDMLCDLIAEATVKKEAENPFSDVAKLVKQAEEAGFTRSEALRFIAIAVGEANKK